MKSTPSFMNILIVDNDSKALNTYQKTLSNSK